jgi:2,3-bisphosphoglycerate-dependent phosphoglycerate mutase
MAFAEGPRMGVHVEVGEHSWEIGSASFLHAFFSTASVHLEPAGWGSRFPVLMRQLYQGRLSAAHVEEARQELADIRRGSGGFPPAAVVWDVEDRSKRPPWGDNMSPTITSLADYFVTSNGRDLFEVLAEAMGEAERSGCDMIIR